MNPHVAWHTYGSTDSVPLVLLHGGHGSHEHWVRNVDALSKRFHIFVPDLPGYGDSGNTPEPTMASLVDATCAAIDAQLGSQTSIRLAGFSFGGLVATLLAAKRKNISHLVLLGPAGHATTRRPIGKLQDWKDVLQVNNHVVLQAVMRHNLLMHMLANDVSADEAAVALHTQACLKARFFSKKISRAGGLQEALMAAKQTNPALEVSCIWGEHDVTCTPADVLAWMQSAIGLEHNRIVLGVGHWVQYEAAETTNAFLLKAL